MLLDERPDVLNHNVETVARLQRAVRPSAGYARSLSVLARAKAAGLTTKSGLIVGMGETDDEVVGCLADLAGDRRRHRHDRPVPAPDVAPPAGRAVGRAGPVRRLGGRRRGARHRPRRGQPAHPLQLPRPGRRRPRRPGRPPPSTSGSDAAAGRSRIRTLRRTREWHTEAMTPSVYLDRLDRVRTAMAEQGVDVLLLSLGHDLPYLTGYHAMPLERLTMLVVPRDGDATLVVPRLEAPRVVEQPGVFTLRTWDETEDPTAIVAELAGRPATVAVGDQMWARFLVELLPRLPGATFRRAVDVVGPLRMVKDAAEIDALRAAGAAADRVARQLQAGEIALVGRTEAEVSADLSARLIAEGHDKVNFAIVAAGANAASPHHHAGDRVIAAGEIVLCDFGGTMDGYCSDITRCVFTAASRRPRSPRRTPCSTRPSRPRSPRPPSARRARRSTASAGGSSPTPGSASTSSTAPATASAWRSTRTRTSSRATPVRSPPATPSASSPGSTSPGRWGMRLEDIVVATADGPEALNASDHGLVVGLSATTQPGCSNCVSSAVGEYWVSSIDRSAASRRASGPVSSAQ